MAYASIAGSIMRWRIATYDALSHLASRHAIAVDARSSRATRARARAARRADPPGRRRSPRADRPGAGGVVSGAAARGERSGADHRADLSAGGRRAICRTASIPGAQSAIGIPIACGRWT